MFLHSFRELPIYDALAGPLSLPWSAAQESASQMGAGFSPECFKDLFLFPRVEVYFIFF